MNDVKQQYEQATNTKDRGKAIALRARRRRSLQLLAMLCTFSVCWQKTTKSSRYHL
ncbi:hypothetical protein [Nodularia sphaerocarpa]|uniref:hypothetical protein n=1 Tax=Nodularia sphaerocarpa TaxID=137816 RepID=UPI001EFAA5A0|nr:hypothetical protein [Nodularia sphaerocarpa]